MNELVRGIAAASLGAPVKNAEGAIEARYRFAEEFAGFAGHFPGFPILPAIVEILTVVQLVGEVTGVPQRLASVEDAKFLNPVRPDQEILVRCRTRLVRGKELYDAALTVGEVTAATFLLDLGPEKVQA